MKLYVYRAEGDLVGMQIRKDLMPTEDVSGNMGEDGQYSWCLIGTMEVSSIEGDIVEQFDRNGYIAASASFGTFWDH